MDASKTTVHPNPRERANIFSVLFWTWTLKFFKVGYSKVIAPDDLYDPLRVDHSSILGDRLEKCWFSELERAKRSNRQPSFLRTIARCFAWEYFLYGVLHTFNEFFLRLGTPMLLGRLLRYFRDDGQITYSDALLYAGGICLTTAIKAVTINQSMFGAFHVGGRIRIAVCSVVYRKALRLSTTALGETAPGKVVNLVANDVNRFDLVSVLIHYMWSAPLSTVVVGYFLYDIAGYSGIFGIVVVFIVVSIQSYTGTLTSKFRLQTAIKTDERVRLMDEIISGVQVIKMYAWEKPFCTMVALARKLELRVVQKSARIRGIFMTFNLFTTRMALYCTILSIILSNKELTAEKAFVFASYFNILSQTTSTMFVRGIAEISECIAVVRRLQNFLMYDEIERKKSIRSTKNAEANDIKTAPLIADEDKYNESSDDDTNELTGTDGLVDVTAKNIIILNHKNLINGPGTLAVKLTNVTACWEAGSTENILENVNIAIPAGKLFVVIGAVGAGKSSLISALLGEIPPTHGDVEIKGKLAYAAQEAWVFGSTVRQNITFGAPYERQRYQKVVKACALLSDFKQFPQGDMTIVGERGSSLSGGQKARINLARAAYRRADVYILDDPLSAVDTHVGKHLFEACIQKYLYGKTRLLVTHQLQYIKDVDGIVLLERGSSRFFANYVELLAQCPEYATLLASNGTNDVEDKAASPEARGMRRQLSSASTKSRNYETSGSLTDLEDDEEENEATENVEATSKGIIKGSIFLEYFKSGNNWCTIIILGILFILTQVTVSGTDYFMQIFVTEEEQRWSKHHNSLITSQDTENVSKNSTDADSYTLKPALPYVYIYTAIILSIFVVGLTRSLLLYAFCIKNSQKLHDRSFEALIRTGMRFFDTNPSGRILNRFSKDMGAIDELLPKSLLDSGQVICVMAGSLTIVCIVQPLFLAPLAVTSVIFYWVRKVYLKTSTNVKRLEGILKSPIFTHLNATLNGLSTVRAYEAQSILTAEFDKLQDTHSSAWYMFIASSMAFGFSLDIFCVLLTLIVTFSVFSMQSNLSGAEVGLAITSIISMTGLIQWGMRQTAEVANQMTSVERVLEYSLLPPEVNVSEATEIGKKRANKKQKQLENAPVHPPSSWPSEGCIQFHHVYMRYVEDEQPVLKGLDLVIRPREKVGIVGRTGAGKSSLISALFRLARVEGVIQIDGVDTGTIFLEDLRRNISIIPQDPVLFSGTLRKNLDPFGEFQDSGLWAVLEEVELKDALTGGNGLDTRVYDRGTNFSAGQRQLVCLARAILRNNRILMLDEATANVDPHTDSLIQKTIRTKFNSCTVLTVAHRLNTIMDSDKVLVMNKGRMIEFDHPHLLLQNEHSQFTSLVKETGRAMTEQLMKVAKQSYDAKYSKIRR